jgi:2-keto-3-deoxy-L-rhamnonate aldolase RhmA
MFERSGPDLRTRLQQGGPVGAFWFSLGSSSLVEVCLEVEPDVVVLDAQHGLWDRLSIEHAIGIAGSRSPVLVRTTDHSHASISQALDAGAEGVLVPLIETAEQAAAAVAASRFPPHGERSGGGIRPLKRNFATYYTVANARTVVGVMIETERGVRNARAIIETPGIDFVLIGTGDLALSLGSFPQVDSRHEEACRTVLDACRSAGLPCAIFTPDANAAAKRAKEGYALVVVANDIDAVSRSFQMASNQFVSGAQGLPQKD